MHSRAIILVLAILLAGGIAALLGMLGSGLEDVDILAGDRAGLPAAEPAPRDAALAELEAGAMSADVEMVSPDLASDEHRARPESASTPDEESEGAEAAGAEAEGESLALEAAEELYWVIRGGMRTRHAFDGSRATVWAKLAGSQDAGVTAQANADGTFALDVTKLVAGWTEGELLIHLDHPEFLVTADKVDSAASFALDSWTGEKVARRELYMRRPACFVQGSVSGPEAASAEVALFELSRENGRGPSPLPIDTASVRGGQYRLRVKRPGDHFVAVWHADRAVTSLTLTIPRQPELELPEITLTGGAALAGFVQLPGGRGAAGCVVESRPVRGPLAYNLLWKGLFWDGATLIHGAQKARVGPSNDFALSGIAEFPHRLVVTGVPGLAGAPDPTGGMLVDPPDPNILLVPPVCQTRFFVVSEEGRLKGATVEVAHELGMRSVMTDVDGNAELALPAGLSVDVTITCPGHFPRNLSFETARAGLESIEPVKLVARSASTAVLVLRTEGQDTPKEMLVRWSGAGVDVPDRRRIRGESGVFRIDGLPAGKLAFTVRPAELTSYALEASFTAELHADSEREVSITFGEGGRLRLRFEGEPRTDLKYFLSRLSPGRKPSNVDVLFLPCDANGTPEGSPPFRASVSRRRDSTVPAVSVQESFPNLEPGTYQFTTLVDTFTTRKLEIEAGATTEVTLPLTRSRSR